MSNQSSARDTLDRFFSRLESAINRQHMSQMEHPTACMPGTEDHSALFDSYTKIISLERDMKQLYNQQTVSDADIKSVETRLSNIETIYPEA